MKQFQVLTTACAAAALALAVAIPVAVKPEAAGTIGDGIHLAMSVTMADGSVMKIYDDTKADTRLKVSTSMSSTTVAQVAYEPQTRYRDATELGAPGWEVSTLSGLSERDIQGRCVAMHQCARNFTNLALGWAYAKASLSYNQCKGFAAGTKTYFTNNDYEKVKDLAANGALTVVLTGPMFYYTGNLAALSGNTGACSPDGAESLAQHYSDQCFNTCIDMTNANGDKITLMSGDTSYYENGTFQDAQIATWFANANASARPRDCSAFGKNV